MAIIAAGQLLLEGAPVDTLAAIKDRIWSKVVGSDDELRALESQLNVISTHLVSGQHEIRVFSDAPLGDGFRPVDSDLEDVYFLNLAKQTKH
jgi:hypothetical protein